ncbi:MAG: hypothetical protein IPJ41_08055 [Phycisphaerales bacterium]|nr:hypothetical protein [Phycisphaerales bacterium]
MALRRIGLPLVAAVVVGSLANLAGAQVVVDRNTDTLHKWSGVETGVRLPTGPAEELGISSFHGTRYTEADSALLQSREAPAGGFPITQPSVGGGSGQTDGGSGGGTRSADQPINCSGSGWYSNNNSSIVPYLVFDDFVADGSTVGTVHFSGGVYDTGTGQTGSLGAISSISMEISTIGSGDTCGWVYSSLVGIDSFSVAELNPQFVCSVSGIYNAYEFTANLHAPIGVNAGQNYLITIYATLANPDGSQVYVWSDSLTSHNNPATSWTLDGHQYVRCSPDMAFNAGQGGSSCQPNDCQTTCWYSNYYSAYNPYICLDDFVAPANGDMRRLGAVGGVYDAATGTGTNFSNISGLYVELYDAVADGAYPCGNFAGSFYGAFIAPLADTNPRYDCTDIFGISHYRFTIELPAGFNLVAGHRYLVGVYGIPVDTNSSKLFCWGGTDAVYGYTSWSYNLGSGVEEICHDVDQAFCVNPKKPCYADFNNDGFVDTRDVLAFLNAWTHGDLHADMDYNITLDTRDVLAFLNIWTRGC